MTACMLAGGKPLLVCIDETQIAYHVERTGSTGFWNQLKRLEGGSGKPNNAHNIRVVMAAAYGTKRVAAETAEPESPSATPINFEFPDMVVTIFPSDSGASLQLSDAEWSAFWNEFTGFTGLTLSDSIKDHVASICSRQVRLVWVAVSVVLLLLHQSPVVFLPLCSICKALICDMLMQPGLLTACLDYLRECLVNELKAPEAVTRNAWYVRLPL